MRIVLGFLLALFGLLFMLAALFRIHQVGETLLTYPLTQRSAVIQGLFLSPSMNPLQFKIEGHWTQRSPRPSTPPTVQLRLSDPGGTSLLVRDIRLDLENPDASARSPKRMHAVIPIELIELTREGTYRLDLRYQAGSSGKGRAKVHLAINSYPPPWHVPLAAGLVAFSGFLLVAWGLKAHFRQRREHSEAARSPSPLL